MSTRNNEESSSGNSRPVRVAVRLKTRVQRRASMRRIDAIEGVRNVEALFPDESDPELERMLVIEIDPDERTSVLHNLGELALFESIEVLPVRRLL